MKKCGELNTMEKSHGDVSDLEWEEQRGQDNAVELDAIEFTNWDADKKKPNFIYVDAKRYKVTGETLLNRTAKAHCKNFIGDVDYNKYGTKGNKTFRLVSKDPEDEEDILR